MAPKKTYQRGQLLLPLMKAISEKNNAARPTDLYDAVADALDVSDHDRHKTVTDKTGQTHRVFDRDVRWMRQTAVRKGLIANHQRGKWSLTHAGLDSLGNACKGILLTIFETPHGHALWGQLDEAIGAVTDASIDLLFTSPPYPNALKGYANGELSEDDWVAFMLDLINGYQPKMNPNGSMMINIAETYAPGQPYKLEHISKLRVRLATETRFKVLDTLFWNNTSRLPSPFSWVASRRIRLKPSAETILWISENPFAKADNRAILTPYKRQPGTYETAKETAREIQHPSGHWISAKGFNRDNGGAIPGTVFDIGATNSDKDYRAYAAAVRDENLPQHPAIMPIGLAEKCISFTTDPGDLVVDPMGGSFTTAAAAEKLGRRWISNDISLGYVAGARHRFPIRSENTEILSTYLKTLKV